MKLELKRHINQGIIDILGMIYMINYTVITAIFSWIWKANITAKMCILYHKKRKEKRDKNVSLRDKWILNKKMNFVRKLGKGQIFLFFPSPNDILVFLFSYLFFSSREYLRCGHLHIIKCQYLIFDCYYVCS